MARYEETLVQLQSELEKSLQQYRNCQSELVSQEQSVYDLRVQLTSIQGNHKEAMEQLQERTHQLAVTKNDMTRVQQQGHAMAQEVRLKCALCLI